MSRICRPSYLRNVEVLPQEAIERLVEHDEWFIREVGKGIEAAHWGELLTHGEMGTRIEKLMPRNKVLSRFIRMSDVVLAATRQQTSV